IQVSSGAAVSGGKVPDVVGLTEGSARARLEGAGFAVDVTYESTEDRKLNGKVGSQVPGPGTRLDQGGAVAILVYRYDD
ncbi:MAG: PASTA domain-containing protein, partial [Acidimicrobiia bacterium]